MIVSKKAIKHLGLRVNADGIIIGLCVGTVISFFAYGLSPDPINWKKVFITYIFSTLISLGVANSVWMAEYFFSKNIKRFWTAVIGYYGGCLLGVAFGHELAYFIVSVIYKFPYSFTNHLRDLGMSMSIAIVVCTILFAYQMQKNRYLSILNQRELEVTKLKQLKTQAELQALQSKVNPHFLYNSLNSIASLIHQDSDKAEDMTLKLSKLFRYSINTQNENLASIKEELEIVKTYLDIEIVRFGERLNVIFDIDESALLSDIPRFLLQPLVENALKHGLSTITGQGELLIRIKRVNQMIEISVGDNGTAFPDQISAGYGLESTYDKLNLLYPDNYEVQLINTPEKCIRVRIPA